MAEHARTYFIYGWENIRVGGRDKIMSLRLFSDGDTIPMKVEKFNDEYFDVFTLLKDTSEVRRVLEIVEKGQYLNETSFYDRAGRVLGKDCLSTSSKTLINIITHPDICFDTLECGHTSLCVLLTLKNGAAYCKYPAMIMDGNVNCDIEWYNRHYNDIGSFLDDAERRHRYAEI